MSKYYIALFSIHGLIRGNVNIYDPNFNIVSPGINESIYFPFTEEQQRLPELHKEIEQLTETQCYLEMFYGLMYRPLAIQVPH